MDTYYISTVYRNFVFSSPNRFSLGNQIVNIISHENMKLTVSVTVAFLSTVDTMKAVHETINA